MANLARVHAGLLSAALLAAPAAAQVKAVPEVAAPVGGGAAAAGGAGLSGATALSGISLTAPALGAPPAPLLPQVHAAAPVGAAASPAGSAVALPAAAVPAPAAQAQAQAQGAPAAAAPVKGLEGLREKTAEMGELLGKEDGGAQAGVEAAGVAATVFDGGTRGAANGVSAEGVGAEGAAGARAPPTNDPVAALSRLQGALSAPERRARVSGDAKFFQSALGVLTGQLKAWKASPRSAQAKTNNSVAALQQVQQSYKKALLEGGRKFIAQGRDGSPLKEGEVITSGTSLESLLGILFSGGMEATNPYQGFSGESAHFWGAKGLEVGAGYGAQRGSHRNEPGVMLIISSVDKKNPVKVVMGETLSRRPAVGTDIVAAVVTDGESTVVLEAPVLAALAASSSRWKDFVVSEARKGRLAPFNEWERAQTRFQP